MSFFPRNRFPVKKGSLLLAVAFLISGCEELANTSDPALPDAQAPTGGTAVEKDVERPDVFGVTENALWDGRPSLGGVWVAYPATTDPERVVIRNIANGKSVIGALFRRERENPGPKIQLSSDAATALGIIAGTPTEISIVVLRRETVEIAPPPAPEETVVDDNMVAPARRVATPSPAPAPAPAAPAVAAGAGIAAIVEQTLAEVPATAEATEPAAPVSSLRKPYIQVGTFAEEQRAKDLVTLLGNEGVQASIREDSSVAPTLYRVVSGPISTRSERTERLRIIKSLGFTDAFFFR